MDLQPIRRILVPVDFSDCSKHAAAYAARLATALGARVELLHVFRPGEDWDEMSEWWDTLHPSERSQHSLQTLIQSARQGSLNELAVDVCRAGVEDVGTRLEVGSPAKTILAAAVGCDMIVMGTHGKGGLVELFIGSVAERVARRSPVPVLTVPMAPPPPSSAPVASPLG